MEQNAEIQQPTYKNNWFYRHKVITCLSIVALLFLSVGLLNHKPNQVAVRGASTTIPTATPTTAPTDTPTPTPTETLVATPTIIQQIYPIIPIGDISTLPADTQAHLVEIYDQFLQTPNLQYMTPDQQNALLKPLLTAYILQQKEQLQTQITQAQDQVNQLQDQQTQQQVNTQANSAIAQLQQTLSGIQNQRGVTMDVVQGRMQQAYQTWIKNNQNEYAIILGNSAYTNQLNAVLQAYGL